MRKIFLYLRDTRICRLKVIHNTIKKAVGVILFAIMLICTHSVTAYAVADSLSVETEVKAPSVPFVDRIAVRTNAFDWMLTVPNLAFEFDLKNSEFNDITVGLSAKYNWNSWHYNRNTQRTYAPPVVFNLLDIRPEVRYWYRTRRAPRNKDGWSLESFLKDRKHPKEGRAYYVGGYTNFSTYTFKLGKKGMQGIAYGLGASAGYSIPMYEYKNGSVDVELGVSAGLQLCTRDMFVHNPDGYFYTQVLEGTKPLHITPFPVVSDVRVAFVWRHKSIKDKVKEDEERNRVERHFNTIKGDYNYDDCTKESLDVMLENTLSLSARRTVMANDSLYRQKFMDEVLRQEANLLSFVPMAFPDEFKEDPRVHSIVKDYEDRLYKLIERGKKDAIRDFERALAESKADKAKAEAKAAREAEAAAKAAGIEPEEEKEEKKEKEKKRKDDEA